MLAAETFIGEYHHYLGIHDVLDHGFAFRELVKPRWKDWRGRFKLPPRRLWANMIPALVLANELRRRWVSHGGTGLRIAAAYRPEGGALKSQHKRNGALDLDLLKADKAGNAKALWYSVATELWCERGRDEKIGLGLYCPNPTLAGVRVHIDTGFAMRTWQRWRGRYVKPAAAFVIRRGLGK